jgi:hypothetical protein
LANLNFGPSSVDGRVKSGNPRSNPPAQLAVPLGKLRFIVEQLEVVGAPAMKR